MRRAGTKQKARPRLRRWTVSIADLPSHRSSNSPRTDPCNRSASTNNSSLIHRKFSGSRGGAKGQRHCPPADRAEATAILRRSDSEAPALQAIHRLDTMAPRIAAPWCDSKREGASCPMRTDGRMRTALPASPPRDSERPPVGLGLFVCAGLQGREGAQNESPTFPPG